MTATGLPIASSSPTATAPTASSSAAESLATEDFLLMLGQLLGGVVSRTAADTANAQTAETDDGAAPAENAALATPPFPLVIPWLVQPAAHAGTAEGSTALELPQSMPLTGDGARAQPDAGLAATLLDMVGKEQQDGAGSVPQGTAPTVTQDIAQVQRTVPGDVSRALHHPVGSSAWADELGTRLALMTERGQHSASLRLSPEHLGPLEVRITVRDDQASVWFGAGNADTRAALEQALPRLRELFASQGLSLADAGVFREPPRDQPKLGASLSGGVEDSVSEVEALPPASIVRLGLVDAYA